MTGRFPARPVDAEPSGLTPGWPAEWIGLLAGFVLAAALALSIESFATRYPVPPGGDPGEWVSTSYAYVGLPYPSWIRPGQYPPLLFPFLGLLVRLGGGPLEGARLYIGLVALLLGVATYVLARSIVRSPIVALLAEGFVLANPSFLQLFFFGAYPNLLGLVFSELALAYLVRAVRSGRARHLWVFWIALTAAVLTHSLVGTILLASAGLIVLVLFLAGRIPRPLVWGRSAAYGPALFVGAVGGFYLATHLLGIPHPDYLMVNAFGFVKNGLGGIYFLLFHPYFPSVRPDVGLALDLLVLILGGALVYLVAAGLLWPRGLAAGPVVPACMLAATAGLTLAGWGLSIVTDYVRFGYFLIIPVVLVGAVALDGLLARLLNSPVGKPAPAPRPPAPRPVRWRSGVRRRPLAGVLALVAVAVALILFVDVWTVPALGREERANTRVGHDARFLAAVHAIATSGINGATLTVPGAAKWTRALLAENAYSPLLPGRYSFDARHTFYEEMSYFLLTDRLAVTNGYVAVAASGAHAVVENGTPVFEAAYYGAFTPVVALPASNVSVSYRIGSGPVLRNALTMDPSIVTPAGAGSASLVYRSSAFVVNETLELGPSANRSVRVDLTAMALPPAQLVTLNATLTNPPQGPSHFVSGGAPGQLGVVPASFGGSLEGTVTVEPVKALGHVQSYNHPGQPAQARLSVSSPAGAPSLDLAVEFASPGATNLISDLPVVIDTPTWWATWNVRFVLFEPATGARLERAHLLTNEVGYLEGEFGARVLDRSGPWTVLVLPAA